jgi:uncharacterized protein YyaL (SSP411 family)
MLYDNALLQKTYLEGYQVTGDAFYARIAREILEYILREMVGPEGGFYSATDADSEGEEGKFFVWTPAEVEAVLGPEEGGRLCPFSTSPGSNWEEEYPYAAFGRAGGAPGDPAEPFASLEDGRSRCTRPAETGAPGLTTKVYGGTG